jgi:Zn-dependent protease with chaperone function
MNLWHPLFGAAWAFVATSALATGIAAVWLNQRLSGIEHPGEFDRSSVYAALLLPGIIPFVWASSSAIHAFATGETLACCAWLIEAPLDWRHVVFGVVPVVLFVAQAWSLIDQYRKRHAAHGRAGDRSARSQLRRVIQGDQRLRRYADRIELVDCRAGMFAARGSGRLRIEVATRLVEALNDDALEAALLHEVAHLRQRDPWRFTGLAVARILNPFHGWLQRYASAWRFSREVNCDRRATQGGAEPLALAEALVTVARESNSADACRPNEWHAAHAGLCGADDDRLSVRVKLLLEAATAASDSPDDTRWSDVSLVALGAVSLIVPHILGETFAFVHCLLEIPIT